VQLASQLAEAEGRLAEARAELVLRATEAGAWRQQADAAEARAAESADAHARTEALLQRLSLEYTAARELESEVTLTLTLTPTLP